MAYNLLGENFGIIESIVRKNMVENPKPNQEKKWSFEPRVGELLFQDSYDHVKATGKDVLTGRLLLFFNEINNPGESWWSWSLGKTINVGQKMPKDGPLVSRLVEVRSRPDLFLQRFTDSDCIKEGGTAFVVYSKANELDLNRFLYGMAKHLKKEAGSAGDESARENFIGWFSYINGLEKLLDEEKIRLKEIHKRVLLKWHDDIFWTGREQIWMKG